MIFPGIFPWQEWPSSAGWPLRSTAGLALARVPRWSEMGAEKGGKIPWNNWDMEEMEEMEDEV